MKRLLLVGAGLALLLSSAFAQSPGVNSNLAQVWSIPLDSIKRTYSIGIPKLSPTSAATDIFQICGASGITTKLTRVTISGRATTAVTADIYLEKYSTANALSGTALSPIAYLAGQVAAKSSIYDYTGSVTVGTLVGVIGMAQTFIGNLTTTSPGPPATFDYGNRPAMAPTLTSASQCISLNLSGQTFGANVFDITAEWTEEP